VNPSHAQSNVIVEYLTGERHRFDEQRRTVYLIVGGLGLLLLGYDFYKRLHSSAVDHLLYLTNDAVFAFCTLVFMYLAYRRLVKLERLEYAVFILLALESFFFTSLGPLFRYSSEKVFTETVGYDIWLLLLVCALALHLFKHWQGVTVAATCYGLSLAVTGSYLWHQRGRSHELFALTLQIYLAGALVLCFLYVLARYRDSVQRLSSQYELLERIAFLDTLTDIPNRRRVQDATEEHLALSARYGAPFCVAILDIDHFKRVNDSFGHLKGDEVLRGVAGVLRNELRSNDLLGRWGGEEFLVLLPQTKAGEALAVAERSRQMVEQLVNIEGQNITISCGLTSYTPGDSLTSLMQRADDALYAAKKQGRNRVVSSEDIGRMTHYEFAHRNL
jgi:diguanylate cyclase